MRELAGVAVQDGGRVMPLETYARRLAAEVTGRERWSKGRGPAMYSGRTSMQFLCDTMFLGERWLSEPLIGIVNRPFKLVVGLDATREFFSPTELAACEGLSRLVMTYEQARKANPEAKATPDQRRALDVFRAANRLASFAVGEPIALVPSPSGQEFRKAGLASADVGAEAVRTALQAIAEAYQTSSDATPAVGALRGAIASAGSLDPATERRVGLELLYDRHNPWRKSQVFYALAIVAFGVSRLCLRRAMLVVAAIACAAGVVEHVLGVGLRVAILERAPVSNTFEALLWMGLVAMLVAGIAQALSRGSWYLFAGVCAAFGSVLFAGLVPLSDRTNSLPAVLRSNYWLIVHVLTIVASYGVLAVASILGHVYLVRESLLRRRHAGAGVVAEPADPKRSHPLIAQTYRSIQVGLLLLTAGTILGGVWAADSWGRFWGWDPKETWALISILVYFAVLHARHVRWLRDFGLAAASVLGFVVIVWTFYGVNYVMATGLHSYGFGSGGEFWVGLWAALEIALVSACWFRHKAAARAPTPSAGVASATLASPQTGAA